MESEDDEDKYEAKTKLGKFKVECWSESNGDIKPRDVTKNSRKNYIFLCDVCSHEFQETIFNITTKNKWCPYCTLQKLCNK